MARRRRKSCRRKFKIGRRYYICRSTVGGKNLGGCRRVGKRRKK